MIDWISALRNWALMTILLAHVSDKHAFLAADSCRWDLVQQRKLDPARKLHITSGASAFAVGGSNIDRDEFAKQMLEARAQGAQFPDAARACAPGLFQKTLQIMQTNGVTASQMLIAFYADVQNGRCRIVRHHLPADDEREISGFDCAGPDTPWLAALAQTSLPHFVSGTELSLDAWAYHVIGMAAQRHPTSVAFPAMVTMIRADGSLSARDDLHPAAWNGALPQFAATL